MIGPVSAMVLVSFVFIVVPYSRSLHVFRISGDCVCCWHVCNGGVLKGMGNRGSQDEVGRVIMQILIASIVAYFHFTELT